MDAQRWGCIFLALVMQLSVVFMSRAEAAPTDRLQLLLAAPWYGSYVCNQGLTRLQLTLRPLRGSDPRQLEAEFIFSADPSYRMVDLEGKLVVGDGQAMIRGRVTTYGCQDFAVWQYFSDAAASR